MPDSKSNLLKKFSPFFGNLPFFLLPFCFFHRSQGFFLCRYTFLCLLWQRDKLGNFHFKYFKIKGPQIFTNTIFFSTSARNLTGPHFLQLVFKCKPPPVNQAVVRKIAWNLVQTNLTLMESSYTLQSKFIFLSELQHTPIKVYIKALQGMWNYLLKFIFLTLP